jgi:hypothetical protein
MRAPSLRLAAYTVAALAVGSAATLVVSARRWAAGTTALIAALHRDTEAKPRGALTSPRQEPIDLPAPVARYLSFAIETGQPLITHARVKHSGEFAASPGQWAPFTSTQHYRVRSPGFVWDARIPMAPGIAVRVRDSYVNGKGAMLAKVAGLFPVANSQGTPEMAAGALARFLAETPWLPTSLLPGDAGAGVTWAPVDDTTARATLADGNTKVSLDFHFAPNGEISRVDGERYRDDAGRGVLTRWEGRFSRYERINGMMIPTEGEVAWLLADGRYPYWRGRVMEFTYEKSGDRSRGGAEQ